VLLDNLWVPLNQTAANEFAAIKMCRAAANKFPDLGCHVAAESQEWSKSKKQLIPEPINTATRVLFRVYHESDPGQSGDLTCGF
jgi:hypothetical protein